MSLLDYRNFLMENEQLNESMSGGELQKVFANFKGSLDSQVAKDLLNIDRTQFNNYIPALLNDGSYMTVYETTIKIRSSMGSRLAMFPKDSKKPLSTVLDDLKSGKVPSNGHEKAVCLVLLLMDEAEGSLSWAPKDSLAKETLALNSINAKLEKMKKEAGAVRILLSGAFYQSNSAEAVVVEKFDKVAGTPKADFKVIDADGNAFLFISHKDGKTSKDFQQYSGITDDKMLRHPEVVAFLETLKEISKDADHDFGKLPTGMREFAVPIKDPSLAAMAMFGGDCGGAYGLDNVQIVMQGEILLDPITSDQYGEGCYTLGATGHAVLNPGLTGGKLNMRENDPYWPCLYARYSDGKGGSVGLKNCRVFIWPTDNNAPARGMKNMDNWQKSKS